MNEKAGWEISIFVPDAAAAPDTSALPPDKAEHHAWPSFRSRVATVSADQVRSQWDKTIGVLMNLGAAVAEKAEKWKIDEIEVGFTLSAKGELLFIAEAGAEASIKVVLKPK